ncbi:MAG: DUF6046 domain-containing protein [Flavobacteriaceae bacterium]|nr:DUF6046 domain-containing protein [Flavobacteriaceae bacterium]
MSIVQPFKNVFNDVVAFPINLTIDLAARYAAAFGAKAIGNAISKLFIDKADNNDYNFQLYPNADLATEYVKLEADGFSPLEFSAVMIGDKGDIFAPPMLMTFAQQKALVETNVNDADPVVIERWGTNPWNISMGGLLIDLQNRVYPSDEIRRLNRVWQHNGVISVVGRQFEEKDIDTIYFKSIEIKPLEGFNDTVSISIEASSIKAVNFTLLKPTE